MGEEDEGNVKGCGVIWCSDVDSRSNRVAKMKIVKRECRISPFIKGGATEPRRVVLLFISTKSDTYRERERERAEWGEEEERDERGGGGGGGCGWSTMTVRDGEQTKEMVLDDIEYPRIQI